MQPEQQQRIMGYFIEEAKDHLNTIEQGLLDLQRTIEDPEMVNELFRAAHSVKGGAAMLGLNSIQHVSHRMEDYFKILKDAPVKTDQKLESLFLKVFDALQELLEQLQGPFGLTDESASTTVAAVEPTFVELEQHLSTLVGTAPAPVEPIVVGATASSQQTVVQPTQGTLVQIFGNDISVQLREMLQLFKQSDTDPASRRQLQAVCDTLAQAGEQFNLSSWCHLIEMARQAIAHPDNPYRTLAPIIIKDIKNAQDQVLAGRASDIQPCPQLQALVPTPSAVDEDLADLMASANGIDLMAEPFDTDALDTDALFGDLETVTPNLELDLAASSGLSVNDSLIDSSHLNELEELDNQHGPEVGMAELNSLADLFEGEVPDLGSTWQEEEVIDDASDILAVSASNPVDDFDAATDFSDLLFEESATNAPQPPSDDDLNDLFGDDLFDDEAGAESTNSANGSGSGVSAADSDGLDDLLAITEFGNDRVPDDGVLDFDDLGDLAVDQESVFQDSFDESGTQGMDQSDALSAFGFESESNDAPLGNLGELFAGMDEADLVLSAPSEGSDTNRLAIAPDESDDSFANSLFEQTDAQPSESTTASSDPWEETLGLTTGSDTEALDLDADFDFELAPTEAVASASEDDLESLLLVDDFSALDAAITTPDPELHDLFGDGVDAIDELIEPDEADFSSLLETPDAATGDHDDLTDSSWLSDATLDLTPEAAVTSTALTDDLFDLDLVDMDAIATDAGFEADVAAPAIAGAVPDPWESPESSTTSLAGNADQEAATPFAVADFVPDESTDLGFAGFDEAGDLLGTTETTDDFDLGLSEFDFGQPDSELSPDLVFDGADDFDTQLNLSAPSDEFNLDLANDLDLDSDRGLDDLDSSLSLHGVEPGGSDDTNLDFGLDDLDLSAAIATPSAADAQTSIALDLADIHISEGDQSLGDDLGADMDDLFGADTANLDTSDPSLGDDLGADMDDLFGAGTANLDTSDPSSGDDLGADMDDLFGADTANLGTSDPSLGDDLGADMDDLFGADTANLGESDALSLSETADLLDASDDNWLAATPSDTPEVMVDDPFAEDLATIMGADGDLQLDTALASDLAGATDIDQLDFDVMSGGGGASDLDDRLSLDLDFGNDQSEHHPTQAEADTNADAAIADLLEFGDFGDDPGDMFATGTAINDDSLGFGDFDLTETTTSLNEDFGDLGDAFGEPEQSSDDQIPQEMLFGNAEPAAATSDLEDFGSDLDDLLSDQSEPLAADGLTDFDINFDGLLPDDGEATETDEFADLNTLLSDTPTDAGSDPFGELDNLLGEESAASADDFAGLDDLIGGNNIASTNSFTDLENLLDTPPAIATPSTGSVSGSAPTSAADDFADLEALLQGEVSSPVTQPTPPANLDTGFDDLDDLLKDAETRMGGPPSLAPNRRLATQERRPTRPNRGGFEQTMRVPVKHLDNLSNLVGELVVNRNSLEQDQERLRQSLDNLLYQVQQLSDVGQRMQDLYERSLLESSLLASRQSYRHPHPPTAKDGATQTASSPTGVEYDPLEMDRFTGFHSLSQEMIELIVRVRESASDIEFIVDETDQVTRMFRQVTTQLQEGLTRSRMVPFAQTADRLPRAVRDIAIKVGKQAELVIEGRETLIDKMILEQLYDPMTHLVNNAITHGIESPDARRTMGKAPTGRITIRAFHQGNQTIISVADDGAGIDVERVKAKAIEKGLITPAEARSMSRLDVYDLLFHPGFSTKDQADDFSGRGVGMDVVRTSLSEIRGVINTDSTQGKGTSFTIRLPLTLSISKALCCISDRARIAFPMDGVEDMLDVPKDRIQQNAEGQPCLPWRDSLLPLRPLSELLGYNRHLSRGTVYGGNQEDDIASIVVLRSAGNFLALQVDQVLGEQEIVIKQLEGPVPKPVGVAGATVLGDGRIMPIADVLELIDLAMGRIRKDAGGSLWDQGAAGVTPEPAVVKTEPMVLIVDDSITVRELLSMTFNKVGYRVEQARDGQEAWEKLRSGLPCDIVFCDIEMPRMDGLELLSRIQKDPNLDQLPIAMLTSRGADRHRQMASSLGASGYFTKPYLEEALLDAAQRMLKGEKLL